MKIMSNHKDMVSDIAENYKDTFQQYNDDVFFLLNECAKILNNAYRRQCDAAENVRGYQDQYRKADQNMDEARRKLNEVVSDKEGAIQEYLEEAKRKYIEDSLEYDPESIREGERKLEALKSELETVKPDVSIEALKKQFSNLPPEEKIKEKVVVDVFNAVSANYGNEIRKDGKFTKAFSDRYRVVQGLSKTENVEDWKPDLTANELATEYNTTYRAGAKGIGNIIKGAIFFPKMIVDRCCGERLKMSEYFRFIVSIFVKKNFKSTASIVALGSLLAWIGLISFAVLSRSFTGVVVVLLVISCMTFYVNRSTTKIMQEYVDTIIKRYFYYRVLSNSVEPMAQRKYEELLNSARQRIRDEINELSNIIRQSKEANERARTEASNSFDASKIDRKAIEEHYNAKIESLNSYLNDCKKKKDAISKKFEELKSIEEKAKQDYKNACEDVKEIFEIGVETTKTNGFNNKDLGIDNIKFNYYYSYMNIYTIINGVNITNPFGYIIDGTNISNNAYNPDVEGVRFNDLPPKTIPVTLVKKDIKKVMAEDFKCPEVVANDITRIFLSSSKDLYQVINKYNPKFKEQFKVVDNLDKFDLNNIYLINSPEHRNRCTLITYNSSKDKDYVKTISRFIYERLFKSSFMLSNPQSARYHFVVQERTYFDAKDITITSRQGGESMATISAMEQSKIYDVVEERGLSDLLKQFREKRMPEFMEACADMSRNFGHPIDNNVEYLLGTKSRGSTPQCLDYVYLWIEPEKMNNSDLTMILRSTGGSRIEGDQKANNNQYGVIPFVFIDVAEFSKEKPNKSKLEAIANIASVISYDNFYEISSGASELIKENRKEFLKEVNDLIQRVS